jgi:hypothetical protein
MEQMRLLPRIAAGLLLMGLGAALQSTAHAAAPQVAATQPRNGDQAVAPGLKEIVITLAAGPNASV